MLISTHESSSVFPPIISYLEEWSQVWSRWRSGSSCPSPPETSSLGSSGTSRRWRTLWSCPGWYPDLPAARGRHCKTQTQTRWTVGLSSLSAGCGVNAVNLKCHKLTQSGIPTLSPCSIKWLCGRIWLRQVYSYCMLCHRLDIAPCERARYPGSKQDRACGKAAGLAWLQPAYLLNKDHLGQKYKKKLNTWTWS